MYSIYALCDPDDIEEIHYIGMSVNVEQRFKEHLSDNSNSPKCQWIRELKAKNRKPVYKVVETNILNASNASMKETFWIYRYRRLNMSLTNTLAKGAFDRAARIYECLDWLRMGGEPSTQDLEDEEIASFWKSLSWKEINRTHIIQRAQVAGTWAGNRWKTIFNHTGKTCDQLLGMSLYNHTWNQAYLWIGHIHQRPLSGDVYSHVLGKTLSDSTFDEAYYDEQLAFVESFILCFPSEWFISSEWKEPEEEKLADYSLPRLSDLSDISTSS